MDKTYKPRPSTQLVVQESKPKNGFATAYYGSDYEVPVSRQTAAALAGHAPSLGAEVTVRASPDPTWPGFTYYLSVYNVSNGYFVGAHSATKGKWPEVFNVTIAET